MPPEMLIPAVACVLCAAAIFGFPAITIMVVKFLRFKERELQLEMEFRQKTQQVQANIEQRVQKLEEVLGVLDRDVRTRIGISSGEGEVHSLPLKTR